MSRLIPVSITLVSVTLALLLLSLGSVAAEQSMAEKAETPKKELSVQQIIDNTNRVAYYQGKDGRARVSMTITDAQQRTRHLVFTILRRDDLPPQEKAEDGSLLELSEEVQKKVQEDRYCKDQRFYVYFHRPADVNKMVFMVHKHLDKDDDRWLYLPALDLPKRIAATDKRTSFMGSDFLYEDVSGRNVNADVHELTKTTKNYYVLKNTPKKPKEVEFAYYIMWIHRKTFIPVKIEYFDNKGKKYRIYEALKVETIQKRPTITKARMQNLKTKGQTVAEYTGVKYDIGIPKEIFTERFLRRPPQKYLRKIKAQPK